MLAAPMRQLETFSAEGEARSVADAMYVDGIETTVTPSRESGFALWVHDDARLDDARAVLTHFRANPDDPKYREGIKAARERRREAERRDRETEKRVAKARDDLERKGGTGTMTLFLVLASIGVFAMRGMFDVEDVLGVLQFAGPADTHTFQAIARGEVWRLVTPTFLTQNVVSLFFSSLFLIVLGNAFEQRHRTRYMILLVLAASIAANVTAAYVFGPGAAFSNRGVTGALFAYLFLRHKQNPRDWDPPPYNTTFWIPLWFIVSVVIASQRNFAYMEGAGFAVGALASFVPLRR